MECGLSHKSSGPTICIRELKKKIKYNNNNDLVLYFLVSDVNPQQINQGRPHNSLSLTFV